MASSTILIWAACLAVGAVCVYGIRDYYRAKHDPRPDDDHH